MDRDNPSPDFSAFFGEDTEDENSIDIIHGSLPESVGRVGEHLRSRRSFMGDALKVGAGAAALSTVGAGSAAAEGNGDSGNGGSSGVSDLDVLNYALTLEHLEATYYRQFLDEYSESEVERSEIAKYFARPTLRYSTYQQIEEIGDHEQQHVDALTSTIKKLGGTPVEAAEYTFPYDSLEGFVALSDRIEHVGVSAYAGAAPLISNTDVLKAALSIHSVEADHSTYFQLLHLQRPAPDAFNQARSMDQVLGIVKPLIAGNGQGGRHQRFTVRIKNVGAPGLVPTKNVAKSTPYVSQGAYAVHTGSAPIFTSGAPARGNGLEEIAEDGHPPQKLARSLADESDVTDSGAITTPVGSMKARGITAGEVYEFSIEASRGESFSPVTMFAVTNDIFFAPDENGIALFEDGNPISGDVTDQILLWDAGTEKNQQPGRGSAQAHRQPHLDYGPEENKPVRPLSEVNDGYTYPAVSDIIRVTITPQ